MVGESLGRRSFQRAFATGSVIAARVGFHRELWLSLPSPNSFVGVCGFGGNDSQKMALQGRSLPIRYTMEAELSALDPFFLSD